MAKQAAWIGQSDLGFFFLLYKNNYNKIIQILTLLTKKKGTKMKESSLYFENLIKTNTQVLLLYNINIQKYKKRITNVQLNS